MRTSRFGGLALALACTPGPDDDTVVDDSADSASDSGVAVETGDPDPDGRDDTRHSSDLRWMLSWSEPVVCGRDAAAREDGPFDVELIDVGGPLVPYLGAVGLGIGDVTGDGVVDIVTAESEKVVLRARDGEGGWVATDVLELSPAYRQAFFGVTLVDLDADGDLDLSVTRQEGTHTVLRNDGGGAFTDVTKAWGLNSTLDYWGATSWGDYDGDGDLDGLLAGHAYINEELDPDFEKYEWADSVFYAQTSPGVFEDRTAEVLPPVTLEGLTFQFAWADIDRDGILDLWVANDFSRDHRVSRVLRGTGEAFVEDPALDVSTIVTSMGVAVEDFDGDGSVEIFVPGWGETAFYVERDGTWFDAAVPKGVFPNVDGRQMVAWAGATGDVDNDGDLDLPVAYGFLKSIIGWAMDDQVDAMLLNQGDLQFEDVGEAWGFDTVGQSRAIALYDLDGDLWLDAVKLDAEGNLRIFTARCGEARAFTLDIDDQASLNRFGVGAEVSVEAEDQRMSRRIHAGGGSGYAVSVAPTVHVGVGDRDVVDRIEVRLPDGDHVAFRDVPTGRRLTLTRYTAPE